MQFTSIIASTILSGFLATGVNAWAQAANGVWVANNVYYNIRGSTVHEACTTMNTENVHPSGDNCAYWINGVGQTFNGKCRYQGNSVLCIS